jgi:RTX calcium-binding nonapeptide repeat (4 copies)
MPRDQIIGRAGAGHDRVDAAFGADTVLGGAGNDVLGGQPGNDRLSGGPGNDILLGHGGRDHHVVSGLARRQAEFSHSGEDELPHQVLGQRLVDCELQSPLRHVVGGHVSPERREHRAAVG